MRTLEHTAARRIRVRGVVQGVGFRPAVHRLATALALKGWACNDAVGVLIHLEGSPSALAAFRRRFGEAIPAAARVEVVAEEETACEDCVDFRIRLQAPTDAMSMLVRIPSDRAICAECRAEVLNAANRRFGHPFATCTHCGPRYSILREAPYERHVTSMEGFRLCPACRAEYEDVRDRRFHAEPIACPACGPRLKCSYLTMAAGGWKHILAAAESLRTGRIVALKGLGGYQLLVRADDECAVQRLRARKRRPTKPFAIMVHSLDEAERIARISPRERELLRDAANPIVLLESRNEVAPSVAPGLRSIGVLLPTTPLHVLLLSQLDFPVVATSGNQSEEPIAFDEQGRGSLAAIADEYLDHDRPIVRRVDDSVVRVIDESPMILRLARGFAPSALPALERWALAADALIPPILAVGSQQKTALALWTGTQAILAQHLGDMENLDSRRAFAAAIEDLTRLYRCKPKILACDFHPDYYTTRWAQSARVPYCQVQHHHAHAVACMAEHGMLDQDVLGAIFDGTGFGLDGTIWGGEILHASVNEFRRLASLDLFALPGGEAAIHQPNRIALSLLAESFGAMGIDDSLFARLALSKKLASSLLRMTERGVNSPQTNSVGRLFDAAAALLLNVHEVSYEGEAAILLEDAVDPREDSAYRIDIHLDENGLPRGDWRPLIRCLVDDIRRDVAIGICAARFHNALAEWTALAMAASPLEDVVLGGGCFQNAHLMRRTRAALEKRGKNVFVPSGIPANDGGLAVGQLAVAMARWRGQK